MFDDKDVDDDEIREIIAEDRTTFITALQNHPSLNEHTHPRHREALRLWAVCHGFDSKSQQEQREKESEPVDSERLRKIAVIAKSKAFIDKLAPGHKKAHKKWLNLQLKREK